MLSLPDKRQAIAFVAAFLVGMAGLAMIGRIESSRNIFERFVRIHNYISPQSYFYPTASQLVALAKDAGRDADVIVVVSGDSIMQGFGQDDDTLWSRELQRLLGDRYAVVNVAMYDARLVESGGVTVEALTKQGYRVVRVTDFRLPALGGPDGVSFRYLFWDAYYKGMLFDDADRMAYLEQNPQPPSSGALTQDDLRVRSALDSGLYFTDLWNGIGYSTVFTTWAPLIPPDVPFVTPRGRLSLQRDMLAFPFDPRTRDGFYALMMTLACQKGPTGELSPIDNHPHWPFFETQMRAAAPPPIRARTIVWMPYDSAHNLSWLSEPERRCYRRSHDLAADRLRQVGYTPALFGADWVVPDYVDHLHLSEAGGRKLAAEMAPRVRKLAEELLGYVQPRP